MTDINFKLDRHGLKGSACSLCKLQTYPIDEIPFIQRTGKNGTNINAVKRKSDFSSF